MRGFRGEDGQAILEIALTLPILIFGLIGGTDVARAYAQQMAVQNGARAGAEAAAIDFAPTAVMAEARARDEMGRTPGMDASAPVVSVVFARSDGLSACPSTPTTADPCFVTVRVRHMYRTVTPWPLIPNAFQFDRSTTMRTIKGP